MNKDAVKYINKEEYSFEDLCGIMKLLRGEGGCPWDREQTHESIRKNLIEETYEVVEAIDRRDAALMCEELGDLLLQVVFHSEMSEEDGEFDITQVVSGICRKLIYRHPHIFADVSADTSEKVLENWDRLKVAEKHRDTLYDQMKAVPPSLPALMRADKVGKKAGKANFDFSCFEETMAKVDEEAAELREAAESGDSARMADEAGDLLFAAVCAARKLGVEPEEALTRATDKFVSRFGRLESAAALTGRQVSELTPEEADAIWESIKNCD